MRRIFYPADIAEAVGCTATYVRRLANRHLIGDGTGVDAKGDRIAFTVDDLPQLDVVLGRPVDAAIRRKFCNSQRQRLQTRNKYAKIKE